jgi:vacuolar-type H+-ATPase subunit D/Vma8
MSKLLQRYHRSLHQKSNLLLIDNVLTFENNLFDKEEFVQQKFEKVKFNVLTFENKKYLTKCCNEVFLPK